VALVHGTCVARRGAAVLIEGPPGAGKSDLALRLLDRGWRLVADDYTELAVKGKRLVATAPKAIAGRLEVRGIGIRRVTSARSAVVRLCVRLVPRARVPRLPNPATRRLGGVAVPLLRFHAFDASTPLKVEMALKALT
jgi:HPr kinase/phosphorylase